MSEKLNSSSNNDKATESDEPRFFGSVKEGFVMSVRGETLKAMEREAQERGITIDELAREYSRMNAEL